MNLKLVGQAVVVLVLTILNLRCLLYFCAVLKLVILDSVCGHEMFVIVFINKEV